mmetsp:Transcript_1967/g.5008  ORF Transcript_1967/g.5008 Transcript_1967/m.5008 type:complete len:219 (+) Transcript_1967:386-1042(+)
MGAGALPSAARVAHVAPAWASHPYRVDHQLQGSFEALDEADNIKHVYVRVEHCKGLLLGCAVDVKARVGGDEAPASACAIDPTLLVPAGRALHARQRERLLLGHDVLEHAEVCPPSLRLEQHHEIFKRGAAWKVGAYKVVRGDQVTHGSPQHGGEHYAARRLALCAALKASPHRSSQRDHRRVDRRRVREDGHRRSSVPFGPYKGVAHAQRGVRRPVV